MSAISRFNSIEYPQSKWDFVEDRCGWVRPEEDAQALFECHYYVERPSIDTCALMWMFESCADEFGVDLLASKKYAPYFSYEGSRDSEKCGPPEKLYQERSCNNWNEYESETCAIW